MGQQVNAAAKKGSTYVAVPFIRNLFLNFGSAFLLTTSFI
jgi:hypothetical protein